MKTKSKKKRASDKTPISIVIPADLQLGGPVTAAEKRKVMQELLDGVTDDFNSLFAEVKNR